MARTFNIDFTETELGLIEKAIIQIRGRALTKAALASSRLNKKRFKNSAYIQAENKKLADNCQLLLDKVSPYV